MSWIALALLANLFFGFSVLLDKFLNTKKIKHVYSFAVILNTVYLVFILITTYLQWGTFVMGKSALLSALAGFFWFFMWIFFWKAMQRGEATRVSAIFFSQPIYSSLIGVFFFNESLTILKWAGIAIIVIGAILSSLGGESHKKEVKIAYLFALLSAVFSSIGNSISKFAMMNMPSLTVNCIAFYSSIPLYIFLLKSPSVRSEILGAFKNTRLLLQFGIRGIFGYMGIIAFMASLSSGPISLVTALSGTQPIFVLILSLVASALFPRLIHEEFGKGVLGTKLLALLLTVIGILLVSL